jgi:hypothetical protein
MNKFWFEYVKSCYDLVLESEKTTSIILNHEVEAYIVHLLAKNFERTDIGDNIMAFQIMEALHKKNNSELLSIGDECLLIYSYPFRKSKWPSNDYYKDIGIIAYGLANHIMEKHFNLASKILYTVFNKNKTYH